MQINLPDESLPEIAHKAAAAGFAGKIDAYIEHLIASDQVEDYHAPAGQSLVGKSRDEIDAMITAGIESGQASPMAEDDWRRLHDQIGLRGG